IQLQPPPPLAKKTFVRPHPGAPRRAAGGQNHLKTADHPFFTVDSLAESINGLAPLQSRLDQRYRTVKRSASARKADTERVFARVPNFYIGATLKPAARVSTNDMLLNRFTPEYFDEIIVLGRFRGEC